MADEKKTHAERLDDLIKEQIKVEMKVVKRNLFTQSYPLLTGDLIETYSDGYVELIHGHPYYKRFEEPSETAEKNTALYHIVSRTVPKERLDEVMQDPSIQTEVELHILVNPNTPSPKTVYVFEYPSRFYLKKVNPNHPDPYVQSADAFLEQVSCGQKGRKPTNGRKRTSTTKSKTKKD